MAETGRRGVWGGFDFAAIAATLPPLADGPTCGARTRSGQPCRGVPVADRRPALEQLHKPKRMRCRMHGGRSTGPRTAAGRAAIAESNRRRRRS